jgi:hypothetical protein
LENICDYVGCGTIEKYQLDLDRDDSADYEIELFYMTAAGYGGNPGIRLGSIFIISLNCKNKISMMSDTPNYVNVHSYGDTIENNLTWTDDIFLHDLIYAYNEYYTSEIPETSSYLIDNWKGQSDKYIGLQMIVFPDTIYGWLRIDVIDENKIVINDFAYRE